MTSAVVHLAIDTTVRDMRRLSEWFPSGEPPSHQTERPDRRRRPVDYPALIAGLETIEREAAAGRFEAAVAALDAYHDLAESMVANYPRQQGRASGATRGAAGTAELTMADDNKPRAPRRLRDEDIATVRATRRGTLLGIVGAAAAIGAGAIGAGARAQAPQSPPTTPPPAPIENDSDFRPAGRGSAA
jgi:hypothetical protein